MEYNFRAQALLLTPPQRGSCPSPWHTLARLPHVTRANATLLVCTFAWHAPPMSYIMYACMHATLSHMHYKEDSGAHSPAMLMKRCEKIDSWMGSSLVPAMLGDSAPTEMRMSPVSVTSAWQPGSTRMVLGGRGHRGATRRLAREVTTPCQEIPQGRNPGSPEPRALLWRVLQHPLPRLSHPRLTCCCR